MFLVNDGVLRILMAELVRQQYDIDGEGPRAAQVVRVTDYREREQDRYPGTSSHWVEHYVDIFWVDDAIAPQAYAWRGDMASLTAAIERMVKAY